MRSIYILAAFVAAILSAPLYAVTINYNTIISAENSFPGEFVQIHDGPSSPTIVQMIEGGQAAQVNVHDESVFNFHGGFVEGGVNAFEHSQMNIISGTLDRFTLRDDASVNVYGGTFQSQVTLLPGAHPGTPTLNIFGGHFVGLIYADAPGAIVNVFGGTMWGLSGHHETINVTGGSLLTLNLQFTSTAHWSGGEFRDKDGLLRDDSTLHIYGRNLTYDADGDEHLTGTLLDGTVVDRYQILSEDRSHVILHNVPEPTSFALLTVGLAVATALQQTPASPRTGKRGPLKTVINMPLRMSHHPVRDP